MAVWIFTDNMWEETAWRALTLAFLSAVLAAGIVDSMWKDTPSRWRWNAQWSGMAWRNVQRAQSQSHCMRLTYLRKDCTDSVITMMLATLGKMKKLRLCRDLTGMHSVSRYIVRVFHSCIHNQLHSCPTLLRPGTFPLCPHRLIRGCRTGAAVT